MYVIIYMYHNYRGRPSWRRRGSGGLHLLAEARPPHPHLGCGQMGSTVIGPLQK